MTSLGLEFTGQYDAVQRNFDKLDQQLTAFPEAVHYIGATGEPAFTGLWVNFDNGLTTPGGGTQRDAGFYRDRGCVYLTGVIKTGASGTTAFTLPAGYRPKNQVDCVVSASGDLAVVAVGSAGAVVPANRGTSAVVTFCFLDGVSFLAA